MLRNYLKVAWRNLVGNKIYSTINIVGLAVGLSVCMLIVFYMQHENSYDNFHERSNKICWVQTNLKLDNNVISIPYLDYLTGPSIKQNVASVESYHRYKVQSKEIIIQNAQNPSLKFLENKFLFADNNFFSFFSFKLIQGDKGQVLQNPFSIVISQNMAKKYFGNEDPIGKTLRYENEHDFVVTGVAENTPSNTSINYDFVASLSSMSSIDVEKNNMNSDESVFSTYFLLSELGDVSNIESGLMELDKIKGNPDQSETSYIVTPLEKIHQSIYSPNNKYLKIFPFVAVLVLLLALINYTSLSTTLSTIRSKEIGVRKVLGANRKAVALQFFIESALFTIIAFVLGYVLCMAFQPLFFDFLQIQMDSSFLYSPTIFVSFLVLFVITVVLAATYPAIILSAYRPVKVLYGKFSKQNSGIKMRKIFTVFQFTISTVIIICGIVIDRQMYFFENVNTGIDRENIVMIPFSQEVGNQYMGFKNEIQSLSTVSELSTARYSMYKEIDMIGTSPKNSDQTLLLRTLSVDQNFISLLGLDWKSMPYDSLIFQSQNTTLVLNETAVEQMNFNPDPLNQTINGKHEVKGVLKDFNYSSLHNKIDGLAIFISNGNNPSSVWTKNGGCVYAKFVSKTNLPLAITQLKNIYEKYDSEKPFEYRFLDEAFNAQYNAEDKLAKIFGVFTAFTVLIACMGLFGLATFMAVQRRKEIGVRKVLGASVQSVVILFTKDFLKLVVIGVVIASPIAWLFMSNWLQSFAYRISFSWWMFAIAGFGVILIAIITVSFQALKAASVNPAKSLRTD